MKVDWQADGLGISGKNLSFLDDPRFDAAWNEAKRLNSDVWETVPDIRWRAHVACWAATQALRIPGDFVECGVHGGLLSLTVCHFTDFNTTGRKFWLFDTFSGVPLDVVAPSEREHVDMLNGVLYKDDVFERASRNFAPYGGARLVRGLLPGTIAEADIDRISFLSVDLNNALSERGTIEALWPKLSPGAVVVIDDYAFSGYEAQHATWNEFAASKMLSVLTLPTGQGIMLKA